jgi:uncharacterized iron-regulated protein
MKIVKGIVQPPFCPAQGGRGSLLKFQMSWNDFNRPFVVGVKRTVRFSFLRASSRDLSAMFNFVMFNKTARFWLVICVICLSFGCSGMKETAFPLLAPAHGHGLYHSGQIVDLGVGKPIPFRVLTELLSAQDLLFVGEVHDDADHHLIQVQVLQALLDCCQPLTLAMECFEQKNQEFLDRYIQREINEEELLKAVDWEESWGYDYHLYRPLLLMARQNRFRVLAINAPRSVVREVARTGLDSLTEGDRKTIARDIDLGNEAHRAYLQEIFKHHHGDLESFEFFYQAQCVWEDTMARNIAEHVKNNAGMMIVIAGNGHIRFKYGIPDRVAKRVPVSMATLMPYPITGHEDLQGGLADYVWLTRSYPHGFMK